MRALVVTRFGVRPRYVWARYSVFEYGQTLRVRIGIVFTQAVVSHRLGESPPRQVLADCKITMCRSVCTLVPEFSLLRNS